MQHIPSAEREWEISEYKNNALNDIAQFLDFDNYRKYLYACQFNRRAVRKKVNAIFKKYKGYYT